MGKTLVALILFFVAGCGYQRPVLYPNAHLKQAGEPQAQTDIAECMKMAEGYIQPNPEAKVAGSTAAGAGAGAAIGAVGGAVGGAIRGASRASRPSPTFKNFVNRCLRERGYEPIG